MRYILTLIIGLLPVSALALNYEADLPYTDSAPSMAEEVSVGALTEEGILEGNPDGAFNYTRLLNRAEFMKIAMKLVDPNDLMFVPPDCFPDINPTAWYAVPVCQAKQMGIVNGNARVGVDPEFWFFEPSRSVQYEEAVKILVNIYGIQTPQYFAAVEWYVPYIHAAEQFGVALELDPGHKLTRGQVSRLVARFVALENGELDELLRAEAGLEPQESQGEEEEEQEEEEEEEEQEEQEPVVYDPDMDLSVTSDFMLLGETSSVLGVAEVFSNTEPLDVKKLTVIFTSASDIGSIASLMMYDQDARYLGRAHRDTATGNNYFVLNMKNGTWVIPKRETRKFYVRAIINKYKSGGDSGDIIEISSMQVEGDGVWSNKNLLKGTSEDYNSFQTARSIITSISNGGPDTDAIYPGTDLVLGSYTFEGITGDGSADLEVTDLTFQLETNDGVTIANVELSTDGTNERMDCTVGVSTVTCSSIPANFGSFKNTSRTLTLFGDVSVPIDAKTPRLSLTLKQSGSIGSAGSIKWSDGDSSFDWVPFGNPVVRGTILSY
ncbi:MAG: S-layer homology domain-containing protein [Kiritimatiellales bacterium]|nr:S-layer homology domain-containing protein [Kiritimatiellales bacterium]